MNRPPQTTSTHASAPVPASESPNAGLRHASEIALQCGLSPESLLSGLAPLQTGTGATPAAEWARSGAMDLSGDPAGPPEFAAGALASAARGAEILLRALAPAGAFADLDAPALLGERAAIAGLERRGDISCGGAARLLSTQNGFIVAHLPRDADWQSLPAWLETGDDPAWRAPAESNAEARWARLSEILPTRDSDTLIERGRLLGLAVAPAPAQIPENLPLFRASQLSERQPRARRDVPCSDGTAERPLRLLDLSTLWAGPLAASLLAQCGIEVLKIESPERPDGARLGPTDFFDLMNGGKAGCALDLRATADRSQFEALLGQADLVIESARPRAMEQLGYDAASWVSASPGRIWASITGYGRADPGIAFGDDAAVAAGMAWPPEAPGHPHSAQRPTFCGDAVADPLTGMHTAALMLGWLRKGRGGLLDISLRDVTAHAARAAEEGLIAPLEEKDGKWHLLFPEAEIPVAAPRARPVTSAAPSLCGPTKHLIQHWTRPC